MAKTESGPAVIGATMPRFQLPDVDGRLHANAELTGANGTLVAFLCTHCPYVKHIAPALAEITEDLRHSGIATIAINPNDPAENPEDGPDGMRAAADEYGYRFPYLIDTDQDTTRSFRAVCTPDFFLFDRHDSLYYRGQLDSSRPGNWLPVTGEDLRGAVAAMLTGESAPAIQTPSLGCSIKWREQRPSEQWEAR
ncbi:MULTISPECIES: thioredoxin family protein [unclassified Nocardia]|uniref:thioredoxin family protein n=1 Tax=unclassified Nocardia TaxID=2637762 RepID=UPI001CE452B2|nr:MULTISPECIES: thioredoxin family protein [unclassified Nocardia]